MSRTGFFQSTASWACVAGAALLLGGSLGATAAEKTHHWGYAAENGPSHWSKMTSKFRTCGSGHQQSPIDLPTKTSIGAPRLTFNYETGPASVVNNGHTIQVNVAQGSSVKIGNRSFRLVQFHFHTPSENTVDGLHFPMETHFVHADDEGNLAVVAVLVKAGVKGLVDTLPKPMKAGSKANTNGVINPLSLIPSDRRHYTFKGSLTTPPCSEGVTWIVMKRPATADIATISQMKAILGANNRPVKPHNGRRIWASN